MPEGCIKRYGFISYRVTRWRSSSGYYIVVFDERIAA